MMRENVELPDGMKPKGHVKLELIDKDNGEVVDTIEQDNFISKGMEWLYMLKMKELFQYGMVDYGTGEGLPYTYPFEHIILTDASHPEDPENEWLVKGNIIGQAQSTTTSVPSGATRGTFSKDGSFVRDNMVRFVFHFTEERANGEISSVYFRPTNIKAPVSSSTTLAERQLKMYKVAQLEGGYSSVNGSTGKDNIIHHGDYFIRYYMIGDTRDYFIGIIQVYDLDFKLLGSRSFKRAYRNISMISMAIVEGNVYFTFGQDVFKMTIADLLTKVQYSTADDPYLVDELTPDYNINDGYPVGLFFDETNRRFIVMTKPDYNSSTRTVSLYSMDFNILHTYEYNPPSSINTNANMVYEDGQIIVGGYTLNVETGELVSQGFTGFKGFDSEGNMLVERYSSSSDSESLLIIPKFSISSRAKLSSPIIKTEQHVMRVTYDFILPSLFGDNN